MATIQLTRDDAQSLLKLLDMFGTAQHAAYQLSLNIQAIRPYTDRRTERLHSLLRRIDEARPEVATKAIETLRLIAARKAVQS